jgi:hypothetical protein
MSSHVELAVMIYAVQQYEHNSAGGQPAAVAQQAASRQ